MTGADEVVYGFADSRELVGGRTRRAAGLRELMVVDEFCEDPGDLPYET